MFALPRSPALMAMPWDPAVARAEGHAEREMDGVRVEEDEEDVVAE